MSTTLLADLIVPEIFADYVVVKTAELSRLVQSGIATVDPTIQARAAGGGYTVNLPFFADLQGASVPMDDSGVEIEPENFSGLDDVAVKVLRRNAWANSDVVTSFAGVDPVQALANRISSYWVRETEHSLIATLKGAFGGALASSHVLDVTGATGSAVGQPTIPANGLSASNILDAAQLIGDNAELLVGIAMHSAKFTQLKKGNLIQYQTVTETEQTQQIPTYLGYAVIVDDNCPFDTTTGDFYSYLFSTGAVAWADVPVKNAIEFWRRGLADQDNLISRKGYIAHLRGVKWNTTTVNPNNAALATAGNWAKVYGDKQIRAVQIISK